MARTHPQAIKSEPAGLEPSPMPTNHVKVDYVSVCIYVSVHVFACKCECAYEFACVCTFECMCMYVSASMYMQSI